jgi:hypothetical protein
MVFNQQNYRHLLTLLLYHVHVVIHWPCYCTVHVYVVIYFCYSVWSFLCDRESVHDSYCLCIHCVSVLSRGRALVLYKHFCTWSHAWNWIYNALNCLRGEVVVRYVDIGGNCWPSLFNLSFHICFIRYDVCTIWTCSCIFGTLVLFEVKFFLKY